MGFLKIKKMLFILVLLLFCYLLSSQAIYISPQQAEKLRNYITNLEKDRLKQDLLLQQQLKEFQIQKKQLQNSKELLRKKSESLQISNEILEKQKEQIQNSEIQLRKLKNQIENSKKLIETLETQLTDAKMQLIVALTSVKTQEEDLKKLKVSYITDQIKIGFTVGGIAFTIGIAGGVVIGIVGYYKYLEYTR